MGIDESPSDESDTAGADETHELERRSPNRSWIPHLLWAAAVLIPAAIYLGWLWSTDLPPGECGGIGWGCGLAGPDAVGFALILFGPPLALVWGFGHVVIEMLVSWARRRSDQPDLTPGTTLGAA